MTPDRAANLTIGLLGVACAAVHVARFVGWYLDWHTRRKPHHGARP